MRKLYYKGAEVMAEPEQEAVMLKAGWTVEKPSAKKKAPEVEEVKEEETSEAPKKILKKKPIVKKSESKE